MTCIPQEIVDPMIWEQIEKVLSVVSGRWTIRILVALLHGRLRTAELCRAIPEARKKMVIDSLYRLEKAGLIQRFDLSKGMKHVEYMLAPGVHLQVQALINAAAMGL